MKPVWIRILTTAFAVVLTTSPGYSQARPQAEGGFNLWHDAEISGGATGEFTSVLPTNNAAAPQSTTDALGGLISFKDRPIAWAGIEFNYGFSEFTERYGLPADYRLKTDVQEATGAYFFRTHIGNLQ